MRPNAVLPQAGTLMICEKKTSHVRQLSAHSSNAHPHCKACTPCLCGSDARCTDRRCISCSAWPQSDKKVRLLLPQLQKVGSLCWQSSQQWGSHRLRSREYATSIRTCYLQNGPQKHVDRSWSCSRRWRKTSWGQRRQSSSLCSYVVSPTVTV